MENGEIDRETAKSLYDYLECEFETGIANPFGTFDVTVSFFGQDVMVVTVEANDEDEAIEKVQEDTDVDEMELSFSIGFEGDNGSFNGYVDDWNIREYITSNLEYTATASE
jgi:hypothetical protein